MQKKCSGSDLFLFQGNLFVQLTSTLKIFLQELPFFTFFNFLSALPHKYDTYVQCVMLVGEICNHL